MLLLLFFKLLTSINQANQA